jgi:flagellar L-ring protein FlgH
MKKILKILSIMILWMTLSGTDAVYAQFNTLENSQRSLFSDLKAFRPGDAIMVLIIEDTKADNSASTDQQRDHELSGGVGFSTGGGGFSGQGSIGTGNDFRANGKTTRSESIRSRISARVDSVDQNGNLKITGKRTTQINGEEQIVTIEGYVRPVDILSNNSVYSYNILDLTLRIEGEGTVSETQEPGLITRFLRWLF